MKHLYNQLFPTRDTCSMVYASAWLVKNCKHVINDILLHKSKPPLYRVFRKNCVFSLFTATPLLAYIAVRDLQRSQRNASVQSLQLAGNYLYNQ